MKEELVSIITPCYNGARHIGETIVSVINQTYPHWEMIIIDDGSEDRSAEVVDEYTKKDNRIRLINQKNAGSAAARNRGIRAAEGRYIALLDADDIWKPEFLACQLAFMRQNGAVCVCCSYDRIDENSRKILRPTYAKSVITMRDMKVMNRIGCLTGLYDMKKYGKVYLKEELKSVRDDYAFWCDIVALEDRAYGNAQILASYRVFGGSTTGNKWKMIGAQYSFYRKYLKESVPEALINLLRWGIAGLRKFY